MSAVITNNAVTSDEGDDAIHSSVLMLDIPVM